MHTKKKKQRGRIFSATVGVGIFMICNAALIALLTGMLLNERIGEESVSKIIPVLQVVAVLGGAELAKRIYGSNDILITVIATGIYAVIVMIGALALDGKFQNLGLHIITVGIGFLISCALCMRKPGRGGKRKKGV